MVAGFDCTRVGSMAWRTLAVLLSSRPEAVTTRTPPRVSSLMSIGAARSCRHDWRRSVVSWRLRYNSTRFMVRWWISVGGRAV